MVWTVSVTDEGLELNLENPVDKLKYDMAKEMEEKGLYPFSPSLKLLEIIEPEKEDYDEILSFDRKLIAMNLYQENLGDPKDLREFAIYFGLGDGSDNRVKRNMIELAESKPEEFIEGWNDPLRGIMILVRKGIDKGVIGYRGETNVYFYGDVPLGQNYAEIVNTLAKDSQLLLIVQNQTKKV